MGERMKWVHFHGGRDIPCPTGGCQGRRLRDEPVCPRCLNRVPAHVKEQLRAATQQLHERERPGRVKTYVDALRRVRGAAEAAVAREGAKRAAALAALNDITYSASAGYAEMGVHLG